VIPIIDVDPTPIDVG